MSSMVTIKISYKMVQTEASIKELVDRYSCDILYDVHSLGVKMSRSQSSRQLVMIGKEAFNPIIEELNLRFFKERVGYSEVQQELFAAWKWLVFKIVRSNDLPELPSLDFKNFEDVKKLIQYCESNAQ